MEPESGRETVKNIASSAASYILWLISAAAGIGTLLVARRLIIETAYALNVNPWAHGAIDKFGLLFLAIAWIVLTYATDWYYRKAAAVDLRKLLRRFALITSTQIVFAGLALALIYLMD